MMIPLRPGALANPARLDLAVIEAMMMWPDDEAVRAAWVVAAQLAEGERLIDRLPETSLRTLARDALNGPRLPELMPEADRRHAEGMLAGYTLLAALPGNATLGEIRLDICNQLRRLYQVQPQTLANRKQFRPVAHFWAAYLFASLNGADTFPCKIANLAAFIGTAEAIRKLAETIRPGKAPSALMRKGEAVQLPAGVIAALPALRIEMN